VVLKLSSETVPGTDSNFWPMAGRGTARSFDSYMRADRSSPTERELDILRLISRGRTNRAIGAALDITEGTVKGHLQRIYRKLRVANRKQAAILHRKLETPPHLPADVDR
jgi:DNA-binding NarL/FixJ family response regulator